MLSCTAEAIYDEVVKVLAAKGLNIQNMFAAGTDGASVMTGKHKGVTTQFSVNINPHIICIHCMAHRLALAASSAAHSTTLIDKFHTILNQIYNYFHYSTKHKSNLKRIFEVLQHQERQFVRPCDTRWLSVSGAVEAVIANLRPLYLALASDRDSGDSVARGLLKGISTYKFLATLYLLGDVMPHLTSLSLQFQKSSADLSVVNAIVNATVAVIKGMIDTPGPRLKKFLSSVPDRTEEGQALFYLQTLSGRGDQSQTENVFVSRLAEGEDGIIIYDSKVDRQAFFKNKTSFLRMLADNEASRLEQSDLLQAFEIFVPAKLPPQSSAEYKNYGESEMELLSAFYGAEKTDANGKIHPAIIDEKVKDEWPVVKELLSANFRSYSFQDVWSYLLNKSQGCLDPYPNIAKLVTIALLIPVNTADCERGFPRYNRIKTKARARLKVTTVSCLMTLGIETPTLHNMNEFDFHRAFEIWAHIKNRRILHMSTSQTNMLSSLGARAEKLVCEFTKQFAQPKVYLGQDC